MLKAMFTALIVTLFSISVFAGQGENDGSAEVFAELYGNNDWELSNHVDMGVAEAAVPGEITYGDMQRFHFVHGHCNLVRQYFTFYTVQPNDFKKLEGKVMIVEVDGKELGAEVLYAIKAMSGHIVWFSFGLYDKDAHLQFLRKSKKISIKLVDGNGFIASEYFDVLENEWSLEGIEDAFSRAHAMCLLSTVNNAVQTIRELA